tara:strand:+ start:9163 stop:9561 length:399 start_codon:yes stop_codon:yes gene_type:complete
MFDIIYSVLTACGVEKKNINFTPDQRIEFKVDDLFGNIVVVQFNDDPKWFNFECSGEKTMSAYPSPESKQLASGFLHGLKNNGCRVYGHNKVPGRRGHFKQSFCYGDTTSGRLFITCDLFVGNDAREKETVR